MGKFVEREDQAFSEKEAELVGIAGSLLLGEILFMAAANWPCNHTGANLLPLDRLDSVRTRTPYLSEEEFNTLFETLVDKGFLEVLEIRGDDGEWKNVCKPASNPPNPPGGDFPHLINVGEAVRRGVNQAFADLDEGWWRKGGPPKEVAELIRAGRQTMDWREELRRQTG